MSYARTSYTGPLKNRGVDAQGRAKVSREELADFKAQYGQDKTLRDLLNADRTGQLPKPAEPVEQRYPGRQSDDGKARGAQGANLLTRQEQRYPGMREEAASDESGRFRSRRVDDDSMRYRGERSYIAKPVEPAGPTAEQLAQYEEMMRPGRDAIEGVYPELALVPAAKGAEKLARAGLGALRGAIARKEAAKEAIKSRRSEPTMRGDESLSLGRPGRSDPYMRSDEEIVPIRFGRTEPEFKKGGAVKASRGDGICKRGHTKGTMR